jgi:hypothetical protein
MFRILILCLLIFGGEGRIIAGNDFYNGATTVVPVLHKGEGSVHDVEAAPSDLDVKDLHSALIKGCYDLHLPETQPTESDAVENRENFKDAARQSWKAAASGTQKREAGFVVYPEALREPDQVGPNPGDEMELRVPKSALGSAHTHPNDRQSDPSPADIATAKKSNKWIWVVSRDGWYSVSPKGDVQRIYKSADWMKDQKKK